MKDGKSEAKILWEQLSPRIPDLQDKANVITAFYLSNARSKKRILEGLRNTVWPDMTQAEFDDVYKYWYAAFGRDYMEFERYNY